MSETKVIIGVIASSASRPMFRRCGFTFTREPRRVDLSEVTPAQLEVLVASQRSELHVEPIEGTAAERDELEKRRGTNRPPKSSDREPNPQATSYRCTAVRSDFRRCGITFPLHKEIVVPASALSPDQRAYLLNSDPADLVVRESGDETASPAPAAPPEPPPHEPEEHHRTRAEQRAIDRADRK